MAKSFNQVILMGNLARDPEMRTIPSGQNVASFTVATNRSWQGQDGERQEQADFHDVVAWGKLAELVGQYLSKGRKVMIVGRLQTRSWEAQDGSKRYKTEIVANDVTFLDRAGDDSGGSYTPPSSDMNSDEPKAAPKKESKSQDVTIDNLDDEVDLSEIPF